MNKSAKAIFWIIIFFCLLLATDQFLLRVEFKSGGMQVTREFYLDFRQRLIGLAGEPSPASVEEVIIEQATPQPAAPAGGSPRYLYADENGELQFANSMEDIPPRFRQQAERLEE